MANTTNFGWETPDDTDLVKDGAAAMRTLGSAIDTSMMDLKGGTTDQVLAKNSNTDMDFKWVTSDDANAIQNAIVDAKGDLITATAADTPARLAVGTNGQVLTADSTTATGLKWAAASGVTFVGASGFRNSSFTAADSTYTYVAFPDTDEYDTDSIHNPATNNTRFTIPTGKTGYWLLQFSPMTTGHTAAHNHRNLIRINGTTNIYRHSTLIPANSGEFDIYWSKVVYLTAGDYVEFAVWQNSGGTRTYYCAVNAGEKQGMATISYLGA